MSLMRRRLLLIEESGESGIIYFGDTPVINNWNNKNTSPFAELEQPSDSVFNYILFLSKDRRAYKQLAYTQNTLTSVSAGIAKFDASPYDGSINSTDAYYSFNLQGRNNNSKLIVGHVRMTSTSGNFYYYYPQSFEVYGLLEPYQEGDIP